MRRSQWVSRGRSWLGGAHLLLVLAGCSSAAPGDEMRLDAIRAQWGSRVEVAIDDQLYLSARSVGEDEIDEPLARHLFTLFFLDEQALRETDVVYLNIYDSRGMFRYQLYFDPATRAIVRQDGVEHY